MFGIKNLFRMLGTAFESIIFKALKIKDIKNKEIYMAGWYYGMLLALYSFYFIFKGKAQTEHYIYAVFSAIVFACMVVIGLKAGVKGINIVNKTDGKLTYYFNLKPSEAHQLARLIQKGLGENILEDDNKLYLEVIGILKTEQETSNNVVDIKNKLIIKKH